MPTPEVLMEQAMMTTRDYMNRAIQDIDNMFGEVGYAKKNPALVAGYMQTAAADFSSMFGSKTIADSIDHLADRIDSVADLLNKNGVL